MRDLVRFGVLLPAVLLLGSGCATKSWVQERFGKQQAEFDQRFTRVEGQVNDSGRRLGEVQDQVGQGTQRLGSVEARVTDQAQRVETLSGTVGENTKRAEAAHARADEVDSRLTRLWKSRDQRSLVETVAVHFGFGQAELDDSAQTSLLGLAREMKEDPRLMVELEGYTDAKGSLDYNVRLSERRVDAVRRYLVRQGVELRRIHAAGLGPLDERGLTAREKRRVTVKLTTPVE